MAILSADKKAAIANAKLEVFEDARRLEENLERESQLRDFEVPEIKMEHRTSRWVYSSPTLSPHARKMQRVTSVNTIRETQRSEQDHYHRPPRNLSL